MLVWTHYDALTMNICMKPVGDEYLWNYA